MTPKAVRHYTPDGTLYATSAAAPAPGPAPTPLTVGEVAAIYNGALMQMDRPVAARVRALAADWHRLSAENARLIAVAIAAVRLRSDLAGPFEAPDGAEFFVLDATDVLALDAAIRALPTAPDASDGAGREDAGA